MSPRAARWLTWLAKGAAFAVFFTAGVAGFFLGSPAHRLEASQDEVCRAGCADLGKFHRLVRARQTGPAQHRRYDEPWKCECY